MKKINQSNGPVLFYSYYSKGYGIRAFTEVLEQNGYTNYDKPDDEVLDGKYTKFKGKYMIWTGDTKFRKESTKKIFNSYENRNGEKIKIFCMTTAGKEGISLMGIRQIYILEPYWNTVTDRQVIGRGIRICSHAHIPAEEFIDLQKNPNKRKDGVRIVNVFKLYAYSDVPSDILVNIKDRKERMKEYSTDNYIMKIAEKKKTKEEGLMKLLQQAAIDCKINKGLDCFDESQDETVDENYFNIWDSLDKFYKTGGGVRKESKRNRNLYRFLRNMELDAIASDSEVKGIYDMLIKSGIHSVYGLKKNLKGGSLQLKEKYVSKITMLLKNQQIKKDINRWNNAILFIKNRKR